MTSFHNNKKVLQAEIRVCKALLPPSLQWVALLFLVLLLPLGAYAAGLGRSSVLSALGQPLNAEIEVTSASQEELANLSAKLAAPEAYHQSGLSYSPQLSSLQLAVEKRPGGKSLIRITSTKPVIEPFINLLVELSWPSGKFLREYTFLLEPPGLPPLQVSEAEADEALPPAPLGEFSLDETAAPSDDAPPEFQDDLLLNPPEEHHSPTSTEWSAKRQVAKRVPAERVSADELVVSPGDTLSGIAQRIKPSSVTRAQAMIALYEANPNAFFGTIHQLKANSTLSVPEQEAMRAIDVESARQKILAQAADFQSHRDFIAANPRQMPSSSPISMTSGKVSDSAMASGPAPLAVDHVEIGTAGKARQAGAGKSALGSNSSETEARFARETVLKEQKERIALLERNLSDAQRLLKLKDEQLSKLQAVAEHEKQSAVELSPKRPLDAGQVERPTISGGVSTGVAVPPPARLPTSIPKVAEVPTKPEAPKPLPPPATRWPVSEPPPPASSGMGFWSVILGGGLFAFAFYAFLLQRKRKRKGANSYFGPQDESFTTNSLFGTTGGHSVDTSNSFFPSSMQGPGTQSTEVDPIAEAEVYIAYGREVQAEEILREALQRQSTRQAIRLKLLEIYAARRDTSAFADMAQEMYNMTGGKNEEWTSVLALGSSIDPQNPLYGGQGARQPEKSLPNGGAVLAASPNPNVQAAALQSDPAPIVNPSASSEAVPPLSFQLDAEASAAEKDSTLEQAIGGKFELPSSLDFNLETPPAEQPAAEITNKSEFSDDLNLNFYMPSSSTDETSAESDWDESELSNVNGHGGDDSPEELLWQTMTTKLNLATAYQELGDNAGARELLEEIVQGGDAEQQRLAREMLSKLSIQ